MRGVCLQEVPNTCIMMWLGNFWYFGKLVAEERFSFMRGGCNWTFGCSIIGTITRKSKQLWDSWSQHNNFQHNLHVRYRTETCIVKILQGPWVSLRIFMKLLLRILIEILNNPGHVGILRIFKEISLIKIFKDLAGSLSKYLNFF